MAAAAEWAYRQADAMLDARALHAAEEAEVER